MRFVEIHNFKHEKDHVDLNSVIEPLWKNTSLSKDFQFNEIDGQPIILDEKILIESERSWDFLCDRSLSYDFTLTNNPALQFESLDVHNNIISISKNIDYKTISSIRSQDSIYSSLGKNPKPNALVIVSILISSDSKVVLGKRNFYGDWDIETYESPGAFLSYNDLANGSVITSAKAKILDDFEENSNIKTIPFVIYHLPRILETVIVCISKIDKHSSELFANKYSDIISFENTKEGLFTLINMPLSNFHPPSRTALQYYYEHFDEAEKLLSSIE